MTKIEFRTNITNRVHYACRLIRKAATIAEQRPVVVCVGHGDAMNRFDEALWTFSDKDFLTHARLGDPDAYRAAVILVTSEQKQMPNHKTLINLSDEVPASFAEFDRCIELVANQEETVKLGRQRYVYYKQRGYDISHEIVNNEQK